MCTYNRCCMVNAHTIDLAENEETRYVSETYKPCATSCAAENLQWKIQLTIKAINYWPIWRVLRSWLRIPWVEVCIQWCWPWVTEWGSWRRSSDWADPPQPEKSARRPASISGIDFILFYSGWHLKMRSKINWLWAVLRKKVEINHTKRKMEVGTSPFYK